MAFLLTLLISILGHADEAAIVTGHPKNEAPSHASASAYDVTKFGMHERCKTFIKPDGSLGEWGLALTSAIDHIGNDCFYSNTKLFEHVCPNYKNLTASEHRQFIAFFFAAIGDSENTGATKLGCDPNADLDGIASMAPEGGMFLIEKSAHVRWSLGLDPTMCVKNTADFKSPGFQANCAAARFKQIHCGSTTHGFNQSYWASLRRGDAQKVIEKFPGCSTAD
jgi:hypothetical protein